MQSRVLPRINSNAQVFKIARKSPHPDKLLDCATKLLRNCYECATKKTKVVKLLYECGNFVPSVSSTHSRISLDIAYSSKCGFKSHWIGTFRYIYNLLQVCYKTTSMTLPNFWDLFTKLLASLDNYDKATKLLQLRYKLLCLCNDVTTTVLHKCYDFATKKSHVV